MPGRLLAFVLALLVPFTVACGGRAWDARTLEVAHPALRSYPTHRLVDLHPYVLPHAGQVVLFTCRWSTDAPIGVWISADFDERERALAEQALGAWEGAGLGVRFEPVRAEEASIALGIREGGVETADGIGSGRAVVDCALAPDAISAISAISTISASGSPLPAELIFARVDVTRSVGPDLRGQHRVLSDEELVGTLVHELGHALGFQGHARWRSGGGAMQLTPERILALGGRVAAGEVLADASLSALYALPSGTVLARETVEHWRTQLVDRMASLAEQQGLEGPLLRVGDRAARVFWRDRRGGRLDEYGLQVMNLQETLRRPQAVLVGTETLTRAALPRSRDRGPRR